MRPIAPFKKWPKESEYLAHNVIIELDDNLFTQIHRSGVYSIIVPEAIYKRGKIMGMQPIKQKILKNSTIRFEERNELSVDYLLNKPSSI